MVHKAVHKAIGLCSFQMDRNCVQTKQISVFACVKKVNDKLMNFATKNYGWGGEWRVRGWGREVIFSF